MTIINAQIQIYNVTDNNIKNQSIDIDTGKNKKNGK